MTRPEVLGKLVLGTRAEVHFKQWCTSLWQAHIYPAPTILNQKVHNRKSNRINGRECQWRREWGAEHPDARIPGSDVLVVLQAAAVPC